jgi:hypothetical protein
LYQLPPPSLGTLILARKDGDNILNLVTKILA